MDKIIFAVGLVVAITAAPPVFFVSYFRGTMILVYGMVYLWNMLDSPFTDSTEGKSGE